VSRAPAGLDLDRRLKEQGDPHRADDREHENRHKQGGTALVPRPLAGVCRLFPSHLQHLTFHAASLAAFRRQLPFQGLSRLPVMKRSVVIARKV